MTKIFTLLSLANVFDRSYKPLPSNSQPLKYLIIEVRDQKQLLDVFYKKGVLKNLAQFTGKHLHQSLFFDKVTD